MRAFLAARQTVSTFVAMMAASTPAGAQVEAKPEYPAAAAAGLAYGDARQALLDTGWRPQPTAECASNMGVGFEKLCQTLPETESCSGDGYCLFHFSHEPGWVLTITTYGDYGRALQRGSKTGINIESLNLASSRANAGSARREHVSQHLFHTDRCG